VEPSDSVVVSPLSPMPRPAVQLLYVVVATAIVQVGLAAAHVLLGDGYPVSFELVNVIIPTIVETAVLATGTATAAASPLPLSNESRWLSNRRLTGRSLPPDKNQMMIRAATLGVIAVVLFGVLVFRLWALQVLHSITTLRRRTRTTCGSCRCRRRAARSWTARGRCWSRTPATCLPR
jgi:hypothetical protein